MEPGFEAWCEAAARVARVRRSTQSQTHSQTETQIEMETEMNQMVARVFGVGLAVLVVGAVVSADGFAQPPVIPEAERPGTILAQLEGEWSGSGWAMDPSGERRSFDVFERATLAAGNHAVMIRGEGFAPQGAGREGRLVHDAAGLISRAGEGYQMRSVVMQGYMQDAPMSLRADGFDWSIDMGPRGEVRYSAVIAGDSWTETGQWCPADGGPCRDTFFMQLSRVVE